MCQQIFAVSICRVFSSQMVSHAICPLRPLAGVFFVCVLTSRQCFRKDGDYVADLIYSSLVACTSGKWFWITWEPAGLVTLGHDLYVGKVKDMSRMQVKKRGQTMFVWSPNCDAGSRSDGGRGSSDGVSWWLANHYQSSGIQQRRYHFWLRMACM